MRKKKRRRKKEKRRERQKKIKRTGLSAVRVLVSLVGGQEWTWKRKEQEWRQRQRQERERAGRMLPARLRVASSGQLPVPLAGSSRCRPGTRLPCLQTTPAPSALPLPASSSLHVRICPHSPWTRSVVAVSRWSRSSVRDPALAPFLYPVVVVVVLQQQPRLAGPGLVQRICSSCSTCNAAVAVAPRLRLRGRPLFARIQNMTMTGHCFQPTPRSIAPMVAWEALRRRGYYSFSIVPMLMTKALKHPNL